MSATATDDLIRIDEAAAILRRSVHRVRQWSIRGFAPTGHKLKPVRDTVTKIRYFHRGDVERIRDALLPAKDCRTSAHSRTRP